ncbi:hypothetical protein Tco_1343011 [Tanacetum coccineum]
MVALKFADSHNMVLFLEKHAKRDRRIKRKDTQIPKSSVSITLVADDDVYEERDNSLEKAATTATSLDAEQDRGNIAKTQSKATPNEPNSLGTSLGGGPRYQDTMGDAIAQTSSENVSKHSNDLLLSGEDSMKLEELMKLCTNLQNRVLDLDHIKTTQALKINRLKRRGDQEDASKQERKIHDIDEDEDIYLVNVPRDEDMFGVNDLEGDEVIVESDVAAKKKEDKVNVVEEVVSTAGDATTVSATTITIVELTLAQTLAELKSARPRAKGLVIPEKEPTIPLKDKGKSIMVEEPLKIKKKDQVLFDTQEAIRLQAQFDEEERIAREKEEANAALIAQWNDI